MTAFNTTLTKSLNIFITKIWADLPPTGLIKYWYDIIEADPNLTDVYMTIDIIFGGNNRYFISTQPIRTTDGQNNIYQYIPLLQEEPAIVAQYTLGTSQPSQRSFSISFDPRLLDPITILNNGESLAGIAEISLQKDGGEYDNRFVIMRGDMSGGVSFGTNNELITTDIIDPAYTSDKIIPELFCSIETIPTIPDTYIGHRYPLIFDSYPYVPCISTSDTTLGPTFLVCAGHDHVVNKIYINGNEKGSEDTYRGWAAFYTYDNQGNEVTVVRFVVSDPPWESGDSVYADVSRRVYNSQMVVKDNNVQTIINPDRNLIEIIKDILIRGSLLTEAGFDADLFGKAEKKLSSLKVKCLINGSGESDSARCLEYVQSTLISNFPMISFTFTGRGYGPIVTDRRDDLIALSLTARKGLLYDRVSDLQESSKSDVRNSFTLKYDFDTLNNNYRKIITRNDKNSGLCKISREKYGKYDGEILESVTIYDDKVANYIIDWMVDHYTLPSYYIEYSASPSLIFLLSLGDNIRLTDDQFDFVDKIGTITKLEYKKGQVIIGIKLWLLYQNIGGAFGEAKDFLSPEEIEQERENWPGFQDTGKSANGYGVAYNPLNPNYSEPEVTSPHDADGPIGIGSPSANRIPNTGSYS